jgi:predicted XRE-type DNA-binding protein
MSGNDRVTVGSGNVFADIGVPDPDVALAKAKLARQIDAIIEDRALTQQQAAEILGIGQPKVSAIVRGRLREFSTERLMQLLTRFDMDVDITVTRKEPTRPTGRIAVYSDVEPMATAGPKKATKKSSVQFS